MVLNRFRYKPEDVDCKLCTEYRHRRCIQPSCPWLAERIEAGVVRYQPLVPECFKELEDHTLMARVRDVIRGEESIRTGQAKITVSELADEELVDDDTLRLIIDAALLCRYGQAALFIGEGARR